MELLNTIINWTQETFLSMGALGLFIVAFIEASFFIVPPDLILIPLVLSNPSYGFMYALICTVGSVLGGLFGYAIGRYGGKPILEKMFKKKHIKKVHELFERYESFAIFAAAFTPLPYKIFTIAGGVAYINIPKFIIASFLGRGLRYFIEAALLIYFGQAVLEFALAHIERISLIAIALILIGYILYLQLQKNGKIVKSKNAD